MIVSFIVSVHMDREWRLWTASRNYYMIAGNLLLLGHEWYVIILRANTQCVQYVGDVTSWLLLEGWHTTQKHNGNDEKELGLKVVLQLLCTGHQYQGFDVRYNYLAFNNVSYRNIFAAFGVQLNFTSNIVFNNTGQCILNASLLEMVFGTRIFSFIWPVIIVMTTFACF